jgi:Mor family transcriptional regulator
MNLIDKITVEDLEGEQRDLTELIGIDLYKKLVLTYGGCNLYIFKADTLIKGIRDKEIIKKFNGFNAQELAIEYNISERTIREITSDTLREIKARPVDGQTSFL